MLTTLELLLAVGPLSIFLVLLGVVNLRRHPFVIAGAREIAAMGVAMSGLAIIGPMQLFFPQTAANQFGPLIWALLLLFYTLIVMLWMLVARPRIIVYNISATQLRAVLAELAHKLDPDARWAGDNLAMPRLNVQLTVDAFNIMRNVALVSTGGEQDLASWRRLERELRSELWEIRVPPNPRGYSLLSAGCVMFAAVVYKAMQNPQAVAQGFFQWLRF